MSRTLVLTAEAERNLESIFQFLSERSLQGSLAWEAALRVALQAILRDPFRYALAPESIRDDIEIRQVLFKTKRGRRYRALYTVTEAAVVVLHIRSPNQRPLRPGELGV